MTVRALHIDGSFLAYSRFKASPNNVAPRFMAAIQGLWANWQPAVTIVAWDTPSGTMRRRQLHAKYKAGRPEKEPAYFEQLAEVRAALSEAGVLQAQSPTGEADDVIATLVRTTPGPHVVFSADKDLLQLVRPGVTLIKAAVSRRHGSDLEVTAFGLATDVRIKFGGGYVQGLDAAGWGDLLALAGDAADHIPGIAGIGPARAVQLLQACPKLVDLVVMGNDERVQAEAAAADPRLVKFALRCIAHREDLAVSRELVTLQTLEDVDTW